MRSIILKAFFIFTLAGLAVQVSAQQTSDGLEFEIINGRSVTITRYAGNAATVDIPGHIHGLPVRSIRYSAFYARHNLTSITIPSTVTSIGDRAFDNCSRLADITLPSSLTSIEDLAFCLCESLTSVILFRHTQVGMGAFPDTTRISYRD
jgi:hypothetical protein